MIHGHALNELNACCAISNIEFIDFAVYNFEDPLNFFTVRKDKSKCPKLKAKYCRLFLIWQFTNAIVNN